MTRSKQRKKSHRSMRPDVALAAVPRHFLLARALRWPSAIMACLNVGPSQRRRLRALSRSRGYGAEAHREPTKRARSSITALGTQQLQDLHVQNFDDYVKYLPSVAIRSTGPGQDKLIARSIQRRRWGFIRDITEASASYLRQPCQRQSVATCDMS